MKKAARITFAVLAALALPASAAEWKLLRNNDQLRLSIDPRTVKTRGAETTFKYLVDFRQPQGEPGGKYRSIVVGAALRCKQQQIAMKTYEIYSGSTAAGILLAMPAPKAAEQRFQPVQKGSSDEDLYQHLCEKQAPAPKK